MADTRISGLTLGTPDASAQIPYTDGSTTLKTTPDGIFTVGWENSGLIGTGICQGRLTLESGVPISTTDQVNKTNLYFTPYNGNSIDLYDGSKWGRHTLTELTLAIGALTASKPHDIFIYNNSGTLTLSATEWTNATTRATALTRQDGVYVKTGATNYRYLGTIYIDSGQKCQDTSALGYVWNYYNRVWRVLSATEETEHTYTTASNRYWNNVSTAGQTVVNFIVGIADNQILVNLRGLLKNGTTSTQGFMGAALNAVSATGVQARLESCAFSYYASTVSFFGIPIAGFNYVASAEYGNATSITFRASYLSVLTMR